MDLKDARLTSVDLRGAVLRDVALDGARLTGAWARTLTLEGEFEELVVNGVDVVPLWRAEMGRLFPEFALLTPTTADGYREVWPLLCAQWEETVARARRLPPDLLHASVEGEWSFVQTLRHLVMASDAWILRTYLGDPSPWAALGLPFDEMEPIPGVPHDRDARPSLDEVLALRASRQQTMGEVLAALTDADLSRTTTPVPQEPPGFPAPDAYPVPRVLQCILNEEWWHRRFAERDLAVLEARS
jgi:uncharacterized protein YjbI with pentapeptide repeats